MKTIFCTALLYMTAVYLLHFFNRKKWRRDLKKKYSYAVQLLFTLGEMLMVSLHRWPVNRLYLWIGAKKVLILKIIKNPNLVHFITVVIKKEFSTI